MYQKAEKFLKSQIVKAESRKDVVKIIKDGKMAFVPWCGSIESEKEFKEKTGAKSLNSPFKQPSVAGKKCFLGCGKAMSWFYFGKSY